MKRRSFISALLALPGVGLLARRAHARKPEQVQPTRIDVRTDKGWALCRRYKYTVIADGVQVRDCFLVDTETGEIGVNLRNSRGNFYLTSFNPPEVARKFFKAREVRLIRTDRGKK